MAFPAVTTLIEGFPSAGSPPPGWAAMHSLYGGGANLTAAGDGTVHNSGAYAGNFKSSFTLALPFDIYARVNTVTGTGYQGVFFAGSDFTNGTTSTGYLIRWENNNSTLNLYQFRAGGATNTASGTRAAASGDYLGVSVSGSVMTFYYCASANDPTNSANWSSIFSHDEAGDANQILGTGSIGLLISDSSFKWGSIWGGTVSAGPPPANTTPPVVTGNTRQNDIVTTDDGSWTNSPTSFNYQWQRENSIGSGTYSNISGETANQYVNRYADKDLHNRCNVTANNAGGSATQASNEVGPGTEVSIWRDDFARSAGAIGLPWSPTPWPGGTDVSPTINGSQHVVDPSTVSHFGATSHLLGGPFHGRIRLECVIPTKVSVSDVALDYCLDRSTLNGYRWQIDSDSGDFLRLWKHVTLGSFTAVGGPYAYTLASGQGLWVEYDPRTGRHTVGVIETTGAHTQIDSVVDVNVGGTGPFTFGDAGLGLEIASGSSSSEVGSFTLSQLDVGAVQPHTFAAIPF